MANSDSPRGLTPRRMAGGGDFGKLGEYRIADGLASDIYEGDLVKLTGTGNQIEPSTAGDATNVGVFAGVQYTASNGEVKWEKKWTSGTSLQTGSEAIAYVYDDPNIEFEIQADGDFQAADIGQDADIVAGSGNDFTERSGYELDSSDIGTGDQLHIIDLVRRVDNDFGTNAKVLVRINEHVLARGTLTEV
jgi:hypothetical protein